MSNQSLVIQRITVTDAGEYHCLASNRHGAGKSNPVNLRVRCKEGLIDQCQMEVARENCLI